MKPKNIITVDWEDWFHICEVDHLLPRDKWDSYPSILPEATEILLDFFKTHKSSATFFILGYCADRFPELVTKIAEAGHELAYHSQDHALVYDRSQEEFRTDITHGKKQLEQLCSQPVLGFRAPQWSLNDRCPWGIEELAKAGYTYDSSHTPLPIIGNPNYQEQVHPLHTQSGSILEFPPLVLNIAGIKMPAGGGWGLKTWPMPSIKKKINKHNHAGFPATFFIHPVDVMATTPQIALPLIKRLVTRFGVRKPLQALRSLLQHTDLISIRQYMEQNT